jgi:hypothetical protein
MMKFWKIIIVFFSVYAASTYAEPIAKSGAIQVVTQLYKDFAWEAAIDEPMEAGHEFINLARLNLERYLDHKLATLPYQDRQCSKRIHEECNLDFDPLWASQDPTSSAVRITTGSTPNIVNVEVIHPSSKESAKLIYSMVKTQTGWRIADIDYGSGSSLLSILSRKL